MFPFVARCRSLEAPPFNLHTSHVCRGTHSDTDTDPRVVAKIINKVVNFSNSSIVFKRATLCFMAQHFYYMHHAGRTINMSLSSIVGNSDTHPFCYDLNSSPTLFLFYAVEFIVGRKIRGLSPAHVTERTFAACL